MKRAMFAAILFSGSTALACNPASQVTGLVVELKEGIIVLLKGKEKYEVLREKETKVSGDLRVGSTVTVRYRTAAETVEVKK